MKKGEGRSSIGSWVRSERRECDNARADRWAGAAATFSFASALARPTSLIRRSVFVVAVVGRGARQTPSLDAGAGGARTHLVLKAREHARRGQVEQRLPAACEVHAWYCNVHVFVPYK